jgi:UDP-N-acetyl-D-mannosaminuronate dehydrogenase
MNKTQNVVVAGLGEVGKPLYELLSKYHKVTGVDVSPPATKIPDVDVLHICFPFQIKDFIGETARYIALYEPKLTVINSTVTVGTTRAVAERTGTPVAYSPVRGKHATMLQHLMHYTKFVGALDAATADAAAKHFASAGLKTKTLSSPEATEIAKLTETTYFGLIIAWAQEVERYADQTGQNYEEIISFYDEIPFFPPVKYFPGVIGGHCVMPNIELLQKRFRSDILGAIQSSNRQKVEREARNSKQQPEEQTVQAK